MNLIEDGKMPAVRLCEIKLKEVELKQEAHKASQDYSSPRKSQRKLHDVEKYQLLPNRVSITNSSLPFSKLDICRQKYIQNPAAVNKWNATTKIGINTTGSDRSSIWSVFLFPLKANKATPEKEKRGYFKSIQGRPPANTTVPTESKERKWNGYKRQSGKQI